MWRLLGQWAGMYWCMIRWWKRVKCEYCRKVISGRMLVQWLRHFHFVSSSSSSLYRRLHYVWSIQTPFMFLFLLKEIACHCHQILGWSFNSISYRCMLLAAHCLLIEYSWMDHYWMQICKIHKRFHLLQDDRSSIGPLPHHVKKTGPNGTDAKTSFEISLTPIEINGICR